MSKFLKPLLVTVTMLSIAFVGCQKKVTKVEPTPEPPAPVVKETPPPPPPPPPPAEPVQEDISGKLSQVLQTVYFDFDKYDLKPDAVNTLGAVASFMKDHPSVKVMAEGNTDERGSAEYNMGLGENRAKAVKNYLTSYGIPADRVETTSYGEERPAQTGCTDDNCFSKNRRVEWQVLAK